MTAPTDAPYEVRFPPSAQAGSRWGQIDWLTGQSPGRSRFQRILLGVAADNHVLVDAQATYQVFRVPAGTLVLNALARIITGFTALVTMTIGDGVTADGWFASADLAPTVADTAGLYKNSSAAAQTYSLGKKYLTADTIDAVIAGATPAVGRMEIIIEYLDSEQGTT